MEIPHKAFEPEQVHRLEHITQYAMEALEICASLGDYQSALPKFKNRKNIYERAIQGFRQIVPLSFYAFYTVNENSFDIDLEHCETYENERYIRDTVDYLIEKGTVALALREKRTLTAHSRDRKFQLLIHSLATTSRSYGVFFGFLEKMPLAWSIVDRMTTIIMKSACYALANYDLYQVVNRKNAELIEKNNKLAKSESVHRNIFENTGNPTVLVNGEGLITYANSQFLSFSGWKRERLVNRKRYSDFIAVDSRNHFSQLLHDAGKNRPDKLTEYIFENDLQEKKTVFLNICPLGQDGQYIISLTDVTLLRSAEKQLYFLAFHDPLTNLPNRMLFQDRLEQAIKKQKRHREYDYAVMFIDLDRFKTINDTLGHDIGDRLLIEAGQRIAASVRETDTVARFGGDEFVILLEDIQVKGHCDVVSKRILRNFDNPFHIDDHEILVSLSIGVHVSSAQTVAESDVIRLADISMYEAKKQGHNKVVFFQDIKGEEIKKNLYLENQIYKGIQKSEFFIQYQPLMGLDDNRLYGVETHVRWAHPELGMMGADNFIPIAEEAGLIIPLGNRIFELAFRDFAGWMDMYPGTEDLFLSIRLTTKQILYAGLIDDIRKIATNTGFPLKNLIFEVNERILTVDTNGAVDVIEKLKNLGVAISLNDFGSGYFSLQYLNRFSIDSVKIDKRLIHDTTGNQTSVEVLASMLGLCRKLNFKIVAEGIDNLKQLENLKNMNCQLGQGDYFGPPRDKASIEELLFKKFC